MFTGLADKMRTQEEQEEGQEASRNIWENRQYIFMLVPIITLSLAAIAGLVFVRRDTPLSTVNCQKKPLTAYDQLVKQGVENTSEPIPMSREEFEINAEKEFEALGTSNTFIGVVKKSFLGPILVLIGVAFIDSVIEQVFWKYYYWYAANYLGKGYFRDFLPMLILEHSVSLGGIVACIALYMWVKDIRFIPPSALLIASLGAVICASVNVIAEDGYPRDVEEISNSLVRITAGVVLLILSRHVYLSTFKVVLMDLFPTNSRARGVFVYRAIEILFASSISAISEEFKTSRSFMIILAVISAGIGALIFAVFYTTQWFENSLVCRDPELDAGWLIDHSQQPTTIVGSRDKVIPTSSSNSGAVVSSFRF